MKVIVRDTNGNTLFRTETSAHDWKNDVLDYDGVLDDGIDVLEAHLTDNFEAIVVTVRTT